MIPIHRFSKTQINTFANDCQMRWVWRYLEGKKIPPSGAMKLGLGIHETAAHNFEQKADSRKDLPLSDQTDYFAQTWEDGLKAEEVVFDPGQSAAAMKDQGVDMVRAHAAGIAPKVQPENRAAVEQKIWNLIVMEKSLEGVEKNLIFTLAGPEWRDAGDQAIAKVAELENEGRELVAAYQLDSIIDITDDKGIIRELKTRASSPQQLDADKLVDLTQYAIARRLKTKEVEKGLAMDVIVKTKQAQAVSLHTTRSREQIEFHLNRIGNMAKAIDHRIFVPRTDWFGCSPKFCGYWSICAGKGLATVDLGVNLEANLRESVKRAEEAKANQEARKEEVQQEKRAAEDRTAGGARAGQGSGTNGGNSAAAGANPRQRSLRIARSTPRRRSPDPTA